MYRILILVITIICLTGCQEKDAPLQRAIENLESSWSPDGLEEFAKKPDSIALPEVHFGQAMAFRNQELRNPEDSTLLKYFHSLGIYHEDYMSGIVFTSLHRKLNGKPIELDAQIANVHSIMDEVRKRENKNIARAKKYYAQYQIGDTVQIRMPVRNGRNAVRLEYPEESNWEIDDSKDLLITGPIEEKSDVNDTLEMFFRLKVLSMNQDSLQVLMEEVQIGDTMKVDLLHDIVENK